MIRAALILFLCAGCATSGNTGMWYHPRAWTDGEKAVLVWSILAVGADMFTTCQFLSNPNNYEINPYMTARPSNGRVVITLSLSHLALIAVAHYNPSCRYALLGSKATVNTVFAVHNSTLERGD